MIQFILILALLFGAVFGLEWLKDQPGGVMLTLGGTAYEVGLAEGLLALLALLLVTLLIAWLLRLLFAAPSRIVRRMRRGREERGRDALASGLLAIAAGDLAGAERAVADANRYQPRSPLTRLLEAQTAQLRGDHEAARRTYAAMLERPETMPVGLRGLYLEADQAGEGEAARYYAEEARKVSPGAQWASRAVLRDQVAAGDWDGALKTLSTYADSRTVDRKTARRLRAVILAAKATAAEEGDPQTAKQAALEAHELEPELVPAAAVAGRVLARLGELRRAANVLETTWRVNQHPEIAEAYAYVRSGDSPRDRLRRVEALQKMRPQSDEGRLALARAALEARDWALARETLTPLVRKRPTRNALILMAEIEEAEHGDRGRAREWLARAVHAAPDPVWMADGVVLDRWQPVSPVTGALDAVEWKAPAERIGGPQPLDIDEEALQPLKLVHADDIPPPTAAGIGAVMTLDAESREPREPPPQSVPAAPAPDAAQGRAPDDPGVPAEEDQAERQPARFF